MKIRQLSRRPARDRDETLFDFVDEDSGLLTTIHVTGVEEQTIKVPVEDYARAKAEQFFTQRLAAPSV